MVLLVLAALVVASAAFAAGNLTIGLVMVGPYNDQGWSQAHYDGVQYLLGKVPGTKMVYIDKANPADRPGTTVSQLGESLVAQGAKLVIFSSDDMAAATPAIILPNSMRPMMFTMLGIAW
jgi:simple sugar transport system substrate-binding protein